MKKPFPVLFSLMVVLLLFSCSMNYPESSVSDGSYSDLTDISSKTDSLSKALKDQDPDYTSTDVSEDGVETITLTDDWTDPLTGYTLISGSYDKKGDGISEKRMEYIYKDESGRNVRVQDFTSSEISSGEAVSNDEADEVVALAKSINPASFTSLDDGVYEYTRSASSRSLRRTADTIVIDSVSASFRYSGNRAEYTYEVTYTKDGISSLTVTENFVRETNVTYGSTLIDLSEQLRQTCSLYLIQANGAEGLYEKVDNMYFSDAEDTARGNEYFSLRKQNPENSLLAAWTGEVRVRKTTEREYKETDITIDYIDESLGLSDYLGEGTRIIFSEYSLDLDLPATDFSLSVLNGGNSNVLVINKTTEDSNTGVYEFEILPFDISLSHVSETDIVLTSGSVITVSDGIYTVDGASFSQTDFFRSLINSPEIASIIEAIETVNSEELSAELFGFLNHTEKDVADTDTDSTLEMRIYEENSNDIVIPAGSIKNYFNQLMESGSAERPFKLNEKFTSRYYFFSEPYFGTDFISWSKTEDRSGINESVYIPSGPLEGEYSLT